MTIIKNQVLHEADIIIIGSAYIGLSLAIAVKTAAPQLNIIIVDAAKPNTWKIDPRAFAISAAAVRMLDQLQCWQTILPEAEPIREMIVTDSRVSDPIRPVFLTFAGDVTPGEPFAYMVEGCHLNTCLYQRANALKIRIIKGAGIKKFDEMLQSIRVYLDNGIVYQTQLLVGADGLYSKIREIAGVKILHQPYGQTGIVCTITHECSHYGRAEEHFLPAGPFAVLPLKGNRSSLVWNERDENAKRLLSADDMTFKIELESRLGHHLGVLQIEGARHAFPTGFMLVRNFVRKRFALIGDAAHSIHPISGQGLNLGLQDAAALAEIIVETARLGLDIGSLTELKRYQSWRRFATVRMGITADFLNRIFSNDIMPLRAIRDIGLGLVDRMPYLKNYFIQQAAGLRNDSPRLLLGKPI
ncbi:MAG: 2-octaprenyl-6-methoxyphenol hydroxylase [Candidatus Tokpelaia sp. JSC188]|nr:MAG: 2-octaprenyl-6-methoxyphenol hydroxylase [Candidatus Tokpelaia sp. JSC188]